MHARGVATTQRVLDELGYYLLAGAGGEGPATLMDEARRGEEMGFGTAFISERWNVKEASSLVGAACAVTDRMQIATAATNHNTRHPLITGSWATTMHRLSGGRFTLGIGRGVAAMYAAFGVPAVTTAQMEDWAQVMRRLWHGEVIFNHDGPFHDRIHADNASMGLINNRHGYNCTKYARIIHHKSTVLQISDR